MSEPIRLERDGRAATLVVARPPLNILDLDTLAALDAELDRLAGDPELKDQTRINVTSMNGIVLLSGEATTIEARDRVLTLVREVNGVRRITNEMLIEEPRGMGSRSLDSLITSAVKSRLLVSKNIDPSRPV